MRRARLLRTFATLVAAAVLPFGAGAAERVQALLEVTQQPAGPRIEPTVYGHFVEHLGRGVYEGLWVGPESAIPNTRGYQADLHNQYATFLRGQTVRVASGDGEGDDNRVEMLMQRSLKHMDAFTLHYYTIPGDWTKKGNAKGRVLTGSTIDAHNTFAQLQAVVPAPYAARAGAQGLVLELPPKSIVVVSVGKS